MNMICIKLKKLNAHNIKDQNPAGDIYAKSHFFAEVKAVLIP